jgi:hypothetical protein
VAKQSKQHTDLQMMTTTHTVDQIANLGNELRDGLKLRYLTRQEKSPSGLSRQAVWQRIDKKNLMPEEFNKLLGIMEGCPDEIKQDEEKWKMMIYRMWEDYFWSEVEKSMTEKTAD